MPPSNSKGCCHYCGTTNVALKMCSLCRGAKYCSKQCQKFAWAVHRTYCRAIQMDDKDEEFFRSMNKWVDCWRTTLKTLCLPATYLVDQPRDRLSTHCVRIELERNMNPPSRARSFQMITGCVVAWEDLKPFLLNFMECSEEIVDCWEQLRGDNSLRVFIISENHVRCLRMLFREEDIQYFRSVDPALGVHDARFWATKLRTTIASGQPI